MDNKIDQRTMLTKRLLKDSFVKLLKEKSIYKITVREICEVAEINRSTFYRYYDDQFALLGEMETQILQELYTSLEKSLKSNQKNSYLLLNLILSKLEEDVAFSILLVNNNVDAEFPNRLLNSPQIREYLVYQLQIRNHVLSEVEIDYIVVFLTYGCYRIIQKWLNNPKREPVNVMAKTMSIFINKVIGS